MLNPKRAFLACFLLFVPGCFGQRTTILLDGVWNIDDSVSATERPTRFTHHVPVPGLAHSAEPGFSDVDLFDSREHIVNQVANGMLPRSALVNHTGVSHQKRNYFWYQRTIDVQPEKAAVAVLKINKAQFGAAVWVNGQLVGEHLPCFTAALFDVTGALRPGSNEILIRIGAHPGVLPSNVSAGTDFEKVRWTPGIYDDVSLLLSGNPVIETVQVAPHISPDTGITVQTKLKNYGVSAARFELKQQVHGWKQSSVEAKASLRGSLAPGEEKIVNQTLAIPRARLWSPETPDLYVLESSTGADSATTRFGVREFRFDTATRRAYLNGKPIFMRGSNITLHRLFEDPLSGTLPWNDEWVRKVLGVIPKQMHWNSLRFCIGPVPEHWLQVADETGLLIQNEYFVWVGGGWFGKDYQPHLDNNELIGELKEWMRDNWNHPSVVIWDANNESTYPDFTTKIIPAVRSLDLSNRPWENSYNPPVGPNDPVEVHPYLFSKLHSFEAQNVEKPRNESSFSMADLQYDSPTRSAEATGHAEIVNEYGWLWLNRNGSPTKLTNDVYPKILGGKNTAEERLKWNAYLLAGLSEFWRAYRLFAGVDHFVYLTGCDPEGYTCDNFRDIRTLELQPHFVDYVGNAFAPLGVYLNFWQPALDASSHQSFTVMMVNDDDSATAGTLSLILEDAQGRTLARREQPFAVPALGQMTTMLDLDVPAVTGQCTLKAVAEPHTGKPSTPTTSRRWVEMVKTQVKQ